MYSIILIFLIATSLAAVLKFRKKKIVIPIVVLWLIGISSYFYAGKQAKRVLQQTSLRTTRIVIEEQFRDSNSIEINMDDEIRAFFGSLRVKHKPVFYVIQCACLGNPHFKLYDVNDHLGTISLHHGNSIRSTMWTSQVDLCKDSQSKIKEFLASYGIDVNE